jgi:hypothetical protein
MKPAVPGIDSPLGSFFSLFVRLGTPAVGKALCRLRLHCRLYLTCTVVVGLRENMNQEGTHRFYRFRSAAARPIRTVSIGWHRFF